MCQITMFNFSLFRIVIYHFLRFVTKVRIHSEIKSSLNTCKFAEIEKFETLMFKFRCWLKQGSVFLGKSFYLRLLQYHESILSILDWNECYRKYVQLPHCTCLLATVTMAWCLRIKFNFDICWYQNFDEIDYSSSSL